MTRTEMWQRLDVLNLCIVMGVMRGDLDAARRWAREAALCRDSAPSDAEFETALRALLEVKR